jgi:hypothetical protein
MKLTLPLLPALALGALLCAVPPARAETSNCALLRPADVTGLLGGAATERQDGGSCTWTAQGGKRKLVVARMQATGAPAEQAYAGARKNADREGTTKVVEETGLADKAFSVRTSLGVTLVAVKQGRLIQLQLVTGAPGTPGDVEALRPVAGKALAAF